MEKNIESRRGGFVKAALCAAGLLTLAGCANFTGEGNEFSVKGRVTDAGSQSLEIETTDIFSTNGDADDWFEVGEDNRLHDNCDCHGFWHGRKKYGTVYNIDGAVIDTSDVPLDSCVIFEGSVRDDSDGKYTHERAVFTEAHVVYCD